MADTVTQDQAESNTPRPPWSVRHRPRRRIECQREPGTLAADAFGAEHDIAGVFLQRLQDQGAEFARRRPMLVFAEPDAVVRYDDAHPAAVLLADQLQLTGAAADEGIFQ